MKTILALVIISVLVFSTFATAQSLTAATVPKTSISRLHVVGRGIAVSDINPEDFKFLKIGIAKVKVTIADEIQEVSAGILRLDDEKYILKNLLIGNSSVTADIYRNKTKVGSLSASAVLKKRQEVWVGTIDINGDKYHIYIIEVPKKITRASFLDRISRYCRNHPRNVNCRGKIVDFCTNNPDNPRCKTVLRRACLKNLDDAECRDAMKEFCGRQPKATSCKIFEKRLQKRFCIDNPDNEKCQKLKDIKEEDEDETDDNTNSNETENGGNETNETGG